MAQKTMTGVANVTPTAGQVGKFMGKNLGAAAVIGAMDLLLDGVDYVLDPANNSITYKVKPDPNNPYDPTRQYLYKVGGGSTAPLQTTPQLACKAYTGTTCSSVTVDTAGNVQGCWQFSGQPKSCSHVGNRVPNPAYVPNAQPKTNTVSIPTIGQQVLDQAEKEVKTGNPAVPVAMPVTQAAARAAVQEAEVDEPQARPIVAELDKSASIPTDQTAVGEIAPTTNPETGQPNPTPLSLEFPVFCSWAPSMCILADKVQQAITDATDWATSEPQQKEPENLEFEDLELDASDVNLTATGTCPQDSVSFSVMGKSVTLDMPYQPVCDALNFFKPAVLLVGAVASVYIVAGVRTKEEDQP